jgi:CBS domain-containing protein
MEKSFKTKVVCIAKGSTVTEARLLMKEKRIHHLPIVDSENNIEGVLSSRDLTDISQFQNLPVEVFASYPVEYVTESESLRTVALKMIEKRISSVLLTDSENTVVGIITTNDLLFHFADLLKKVPSDEKKPWTDMDVVITVGEFFRKLSDIGI